MTSRALETPDQPCVMAIVDAAGNLVAYATMDNLRLFSRRHAVRKAYTAAITGADSGTAPAKSMFEMGGDQSLTPAQGGLVIKQNGVILGGIAVAGYPGGDLDAALAQVGLDAMNL